MLKNYNLKLLLPATKNLTKFYHSLLTCTALDGYTYIADADDKIEEKNMNATKKSLLTVILTLLLGAVAAGSALATMIAPTTTFYPNNIGNLGSFMPSGTYETYSGATLNDTYYVTPLGYEALDTIKFQSSATGETLFTNKNLSTEAGQVKSVNLGTALFNDTTTGTLVGVNAASGIQVLQLTKDWSVNNLTLAAGTLIIGLNDTGSPDGDYDDFILAASKTAPTPVPAAVWLLGSGLLGILGFKRARNKA